MHVWKHKQAHLHSTCGIKQLTCLVWYAMVAMAVSFPAKSRRYACTPPSAPQQAARPLPPRGPAPR